MAGVSLALGLGDTASKVELTGIGTWDAIGEGGCWGGISADICGEGGSGGGLGGPGP